MHIVTAGAIVQTQRAPTIIIMYQYAYIGHGQIMHVSGQLESFNCDINDTSMKVSSGL